jgi:hypothetical protein
MGRLVILKINDCMNSELKDCLIMLDIAHDVVASLGWEYDFTQHMKDIFTVYKEKLKDENILKKDIIVLKSYLECINTFDKHKIFKKGEKILT